MNNIMEAGNLIIHGKEFRFEAVVLRDKREDCIDCGRIAKLDVYDSNDAIVMSYDKGQWIIRDTRSKIQDEILGLINIEFRR